jgi:uncharacterized lipoprotein YddW (UPF0748 family)
MTAGEPRPQPCPASPSGLPARRAAPPAGYTLGPMQPLRRRRREHLTRVVPVFLASGAMAAAIAHPSLLRRRDVSAGDPASIEPPGQSPAAPVVPVEPAGDGQWRALWVDAFHDGIKTTEQVVRLVADASRMGVNALVVQVRRRGDAYYRRTSEPRTEDPGLQPGLDALQLTIELAHAASPRLEVHAWIATTALWNRRDRPPQNPGHAFNRHGPDAPAAENWLSHDVDGLTWDGSNYMLDPGHPGAADHIARVAAELVREYEVDGLHLDLIRYAGRSWGYNPVSLERFRRRFGVEGRPAPRDPRWQQWRRDQITDLVRRIYLDTMAVKPSVTVSAATIGWGSGPVDERSWQATSAYADVFQDWTGWLTEGIVDLAMPMIYDDERDLRQRTWFDQWLAWQRERKGRRQIVAGIGLFLNEPQGGLAQIQRAMAPDATGARLDGVALYSYAVSNAPPPGQETPAVPNEALYRSLVEPSEWAAEAGPPFATPARPPAMPWKQGAEAHLYGFATLPDGSPLDGAVVRLSGPRDVQHLTDGNGFFGAVGLLPGTYRVSLASGGDQLGTTTATVGPGEVRRLDLGRAG